MARTEYLAPGDPPVPVRVHRPADNDGVLPAIFTIHGGGYIIGSYLMDDFLHDGWCPGLGTVGVSVEYRLAPETPYPGPLEDCYAALRWTHEHADELGVDADRIGIYGLSAGGGLAAALALLARDRGEVPLAFQLLDCPMLDDRQTTSRLRRPGSTCGTPHRTSSGGGPISATSADPTTSRRMRPPPGPRIWLVFPRAVSSSDRSTDSATRTWTTRVRLNQAGVPASCT